MPVDRNEALVRRLYDAVWSGDDVEVADELIAATETHHSHGRTVAGGPEAQKQAARRFRAAFPDAHFALELVVSRAHLVAVRWRCSGTHAGTGTRIADYVGVNFFRIADGKIVEIWDTRDDLGLFAQLGFVPSPANLMGRAYVASPPAYTSDVIPEHGRRRADPALSWSSLRRNRPRLDRIRCSRTRCTA